MKYGCSRDVILLHTINMERATPFLSVPHVNLVGNVRDLLHDCHLALPFTVELVEFPVLEHQYIITHPKPSLCLLFIVVLFVFCLFSISFWLANSRMRDIFSRSTDAGTPLQLVPHLHSFHSTSRPAHQEVFSWSGQTSAHLVSSRWTCELSLYKAIE